MEIIVNGEKTNIKEYSTVYENFPNLVVIIGGYQVDGNHAIQPNDEIVAIDKTSLPDKKLLNTMMMARHSPRVHSAVSNSTVGIAGLGGIGSNLAVLLARLGVGKLILVDYDIVEPSNLNRQSYYSYDLGKYKTDALKTQLSNINPFIEIVSVNALIDENNVVDIFKDCNIICEAFDKATAKAMLVNTILTLTSNVTVVACSGMAGYESPDCITTKKLFNRLYICGDGTSEAKIGQGLMSPRVTICAGHMANTVLNILVNNQEVQHEQ